MGIQVGSVTGRVPFQIAQKNFSVDLVDRLISRIDVGSKLRSLITPNVKKLARGSHYKFYNVFWRQVSKVAPVLSEEDMAYEINCADSRVIEEDAEGLIWKDILPEGTLAISPGGGGRSVRRPLVVVGGKSPNPRVAIGLTDIKEAFEKGAFKHVTVPSTHANKLEENQGFIRKLRIDEVAGHKVLRGGFDFTEPVAKEKVKNGTWADCSVGLVFDRVDKTTGERFPIALEHVNLTNQPWVTRGMGAFGLSEDEDDRIEASDLGEVQTLEFSTAVWAPEQSR